MTGADARRLVPLKEAARYFGVSPRTFEKHVRGVLVHPIEIGGAIRYDRHELESAVDDLSQAASKSPQKKNGERPGKCRWSD